MVPPLLATPAWQVEAAEGTVKSPPPQARPHSASHLDALQIESAGYAGSARTGWSTLHCARHWGSPLQAPAHVSKALQAGLAAHALDSPHQLGSTHPAHGRLPSGRPHALPRGAPGSSPPPPTHQHATTPLPA